MGATGAIGWDMTVRVPHRRALRLAADALGEVAEYWGFKGSMGRIWALLYLSPDPLGADDIAERTGLSAGAVSMALSDLTTWGIVARVEDASDRRRLYAAEADVWSLVRRVVRARELPMLQRTVERLGAAVAELEAAARAAPDDPDTAFVLERLRGLVGLGRVGLGMVETFAGGLDAVPMDPIRGVLGRFAELLGPPSPD
jgi:DNA-binding transcriptional regulator GbsR (MarR family)